MPRRLSRILVDVDTSAPAHPALAQAVDLAGRIGARVTAVVVLEHVPKRARTFVTRRLEQDLVEHLGAELRETVDAVAGDVPVTTEVLRGKHARTVIAAAVRGRVDLLMRSHGVRAEGRSQPFGPIDMNLLRHCPCPVWIVEAQVGKRVRRILAPIDANRSEQNQQPLNRRIVELALVLRDAEDAHLTILEAWSVFGEELLRPRLEPDDVQAFLDESREHADRDLRGFLAPFGERLDGVDVELVQGEVAEVIPAYVNTHRIDLVVMGTVARTGIAGLLMGNTAEHVLRRLHGSVVAVKPPGFVDPGAEHRTLRAAMRTQIGLPPRRHRARKR